MKHAPPRHVVAVVCAAATLLVAAGCGSVPDSPAAPTADPKIPIATTAPGGPTSPTSTATPEQRSKAEAEDIARRFIVGWTTFIPWDFSPARDWFARWQKWATPRFIGQMQTTVNQRWAWTWNEQKKAFDTRVEKIDGTWVNDDASAAVTRVTVSRVVLGMLAGPSDGEVQTLTYDVWMQAGDGAPFRVSAVHETTPDAPVPAGAGE